MVSIITTPELLNQKGLEALRKKILLNHGVETKNVSLEECTNLISGDMAEFQKAKNAQMLPYDEEKWEISYEKLSLGETLGEGHFGKVVKAKMVKDEKIRVFTSKWESKKIYKYYFELYTETKKQPEGGLFSN